MWITYYFYNINVKTKKRMEVREKKREGKNNEMMKNTFFITETGCSIYYYDCLE